MLEKERMAAALRRAAVQTREVLAEAAETYNEAITAAQDALTGPAEAYTAATEALGLFVQSYPEGETREWLEGLEYYDRVGAGWVMPNDGEALEFAQQPLEIPDAEAMSDDEGVGRRSWHGSRRRVRRRRHGDPDLKADEDSERCPDCEELVGPGRGGRLCDACRALTPAERQRRAEFVHAVRQYVARWTVSEMTSEVGPDGILRFDFPDDVQDRALAEIRETGTIPGTDWRRIDGVWQRGVMT